MTMHTVNKSAEPTGLLNILQFFKAPAPKPVKIEPEYRTVVIQVTRTPYTFPVEAKVPYDIINESLTVGLPEEGVVAEDVYRGKRYEVEEGDETLHARAGETIELSWEEKCECSDLAREQIGGAS